MLRSRLPGTGGLGEADEFGECEGSLQSGLQFSQLDADWRRELVNYKLVQI